MNAPKWILFAVQAPPIAAHIHSMQKKPTLHFVDPSSRARAELSRLGFDLGYHCEVYNGVEELAEVPPRSGIILARDDSPGGGIADMLNQLGKAGIWLPLVAMAEAPRTDRIVLAVKAGALDYLAIPLEAATLDVCITRISEEAESFAEARKRMIEARDRIANLSNREREVLDWLAQGSSNKVIARQLDISPRTVEIHRANMMAKLGASHPADAVRLRLEAQLKDEAA